ncbi:hypothetical protein MLD38_019813 [Melastoma candidum]|uniref:Uncharacterized protein n=1 Tax=Melastoma candidum TaxID=119954 RepID=A0ACB9QDY4_9MYRT|nr:hypothetical protein MLD38_019813 [Melastoma candidum]
MQADRGEGEITSVRYVPPGSSVFVVIMGVTGAGESTIGRMLSEVVNGEFLDADDFHPPSNKEKMHNGLPLSDEDRLPWL